VGNGRKKRDKKQEVEQRREEDGKGRRKRVGRG
jgi:hypothetical protein